MLPTAPTTALHRPRGDGEHAPIRRFDTTVKVRAEHSGGRYTLLEHTLDAGFVAMPTHRHLRETKTLYVLAGTLSVRVGDETIVARTGASVVIPAGVWHAFWNARPEAPDERDGLGAGEPAHFLSILSPGGVEQYYEQVAALVGSHGGTPASASDAVPDIDRVIDLSTAFGVEVRMDSLLDFVEGQRVRLA